MPTNSIRLIGSIYLAQALFLGSTFRSWLPVCMAFVLSAVIAFGRYRLLVEGGGRPSRRFPRWLSILLIAVATFGIVGLTFAWRLGAQAGELINPVLVGIETIAHASFFVSLLVWTLRPLRGHVSMLALGMVVVLLCVAAGGASRSSASQTTVALTICLAFTLASQIILGVARGTGGAVFASDPSDDGKSAWMGPLVSLLTLSLLMLATSAIASTTDLILPSLQNSVQEQLQASMDAVVDNSRFGGTRYVRGSKLGILKQHMLGNPEEVALRIVAESAPGYLRGHAFDLYRGRRWLSVGRSDSFSSDAIPERRDRRVDASGAGTVALRESPNSSLRRFPLMKSPSDRTVHLEIHNEPLKGNMVFLPLHAQWVEAKGAELVVSHHGIVQFGVDVSEPYVAGVGFSGAGEELDSAMREVLLYVPPSLSAETRRVADEVCGSSAGAVAKANAVSQFFQSQFQYSLNRTASPVDVDPILHFLRTRHPAHCEFFGSATVLLLRSAGVPTRYVTGYVADEYYDEDSLWVARNRDAHAWAEAYDDRTGQWFPVESTPGRTYHTIDPDSQSNSNASVFDVFRSDTDGANETLLQSITSWLLSLRVTEIFFRVFRLAQLPLFCVLVFLFWTKYMRPGNDGAESTDLRSRKMLRKVDRRVRRHALVRQPGETLYQFADRVEQRRLDAAAPVGAPTRDLLSEVSQWYRDYADARYQGRVPEPFGR